MRAQIYGKGSKIQSPPEKHPLFLIIKRNIRSNFNGTFPLELPLQEGFYLWNGKRENETEKNAVKTGNSE